MLLLGNLGSEGRRGGIGGHTRHDSGCGDVVGGRFLGLGLGLDVFGKQHVVDVIVSVAFLSSVAISGPNAVNDKLESSQLASSVQRKNGSTPPRVRRFARDFIVLALKRKEERGERGRRGRG